MISDEEHVMTQKWQRTTPELATRPLLLTTMVQSRPVRHFVFGFANMMGHATAIIDGNVASHMLNLVYEEYLRKEGGLYEGIADNSHLRNELLGFMRNLKRNCLLRVNPGGKGTKRITNPAKIAHEVERTRWWRQEPWVKPVSQQQEP